ncbi:SigE family RNA polymerase sigma factor [Streptosporangium carneum]|uniref:DNA-directed RNA polymerase sigma-70 factor n=1 Tax=Streptosporangium carneum TaxID=47481 RepID=A0A9W6MGH3_9ACTN|nr:SigE family RNA polymerase sigma factor [Streptosporangium carneum]GLK13167.1 DNA-directed RNA polymerase sigma-70 factor [Streptosporangium carneum]
MQGDSLFEQFVAERADALLRFGYVLTGNPHDAADLVQEALVRLRGAWERVRGQRDPEGYVRTTMTRLHINTWRIRKREHVTATPPDRAHVDTPYEGSPLWDALSKLPRRQRAVLVLRYYEQLTDAEIAGVLGVSQGTVRSQAFRALGKLRGDLPALVENMGYLA